MGLNLVKHTHYAAEILKNDLHSAQQVEVSMFQVKIWESRMAILPTMSAGQP